MAEEPMRREFKGYTQLSSEELKKREEEESPNAEVWQLFCALVASGVDKLPEQIAELRSGTEGTNARIFIEGCLKGCRETWLVFHEPGKNRSAE